MSSRYKFYYMSFLRGLNSNYVISQQRD